MIRCLLPVLLVASLVASGCGGPAAADRPVPVAGVVAPSVVRVRITLRYDKGEAPEGGGWTYSPCPASRWNLLNLSGPLKEGRPFEMLGLVVSPTQVVATDPMIHPRFIESMAVRQGDDVVKAKPAAYSVAHNLMVVDLERPLKAARPLVFDGCRRPPFVAVSGVMDDGVWTVQARPFLPAISLGADGRQFFSAPVNTLITDASGRAVGFSMDGELPDDDSWMGSPLDQPLCTAKVMAAKLGELQKHLGQAFVRVALHFRSPAKDRNSAFRSSLDGDDEDATEQNVVGILLEGGKVLALASLNPKVTARLERIVVHPAQGEGVQAKFSATLSNYGAILATLDKPLGKPATLATGPIQAFRYVALCAADVRLHGEGWTAYFDHRRFAGFRLGWSEHVYPGISGREKEKTLFLFDDAMRLVALPIARRENVADDRGASRPEPTLRAAADIAAVLAELPKNIDAHNVPLSEETQTRLAWMGVELQALNRELARANKVADLTKDGETGGLVSYVYPNSPAAKAGVEAGWILLRLRADKYPKPIEIRAKEDSDRGPFPWERLDELHEQYYDRMPAPWPNVENTLTRTLTDLGYGTKYKADFFHDGKAVTKDFEVVQGPLHYDAAARYKSQALGITVRDITYELRRYLQKKDDDPGVVISKMEPGSKASVAGIKPFETITHVNDKPVANVKEFEAAIAGQDELRLSVKRMTRGRVVKIKMTGAAVAPAPAGEKPAEGEKPAGPEK
ncbi:MAG: PDZ domain-containing protein [Planctomycetota bacterium]|nr:PDZ domain-containing protein [Planctomycetota bacterium]